MNYSTVNSSLSISTIFYIVTLIIFATSVSGCFITNCPPGGKRSGAEVKIRQCEQCGPPGSMGRCYGPTICCSPEFGCLFATPETFPCLVENRFTTLCQNPGASCSGQGGELSSSGQCAAENVCCNSETCTMDDTCHEDTGAVMSLSASHSLKEGGGAGGIVKGGQYQQHPRHPLDIVLHRFINGQRLSHGLAARLPSSSSANQDY